MGSFQTKFTYKQLLTIKHALFHYMHRDGICEADYESESALYSKVKEKIDQAEDKISR